MKILLAIDGSEYSQAATQAVIAKFPHEKTEVPSEWHSDLIVLGSHGRRGVDRFLLGSVSEGVVRHATVFCRGRLGTVEPTVGLRR